MYRNAFKELKPKIDEVLLKLADEFKQVRTGKASSSLVEGVLVDYYGTKTPLKQMAQINTPDAGHIVIVPWDKNSLSDIELAVRNSNLGLSPVNDGKSVRIGLPPMTEERRNELVKFIKNLSEEARVIARNLRADTWNKVKQMQQNSEITEDDKYRAEEELNKIIDDANRKIEELFDKKKDEIMSI